MYVESFFVSRFRALRLFFAFFEQKKQGGVFLILAINTTLNSLFESKTVEVTVPDQNSEGDELLMIV